MIPLDPDRDKDDGDTKSYEDEPDSRPTSPDNQVPGRTKTDKDTKSYEPAAEAPDSTAK
jgi:hypothetical protein